MIKGKGAKHVAYGVTNAFCLKSSLVYLQHKTHTFTSNSMKRSVRWLSFLTSSSEKSGKRNYGDYQGRDHRRIRLNPCLEESLREVHSLN